MIITVTNSRECLANKTPLLTAALIPILKSSARADVQPVAIGETIIKIAGRCIVKISRQKINAKLMSGFQLGEGVTAGLEASTHSVRLILDRNPTFLALSLDMRNVSTLFGGLTSPSSSSSRAFRSSSHTSRCAMTRHPSSG